MCGIVASRRAAEPARRLDIVERMLAAIGHRGPDDAGVTRATGVRPSAFVDCPSSTSRRRAPADDEHGRQCSIVFNGEI
jgi:asparagine synthetase B (glutamine-hydrolysing)